jgi:hypothetical protein
MSIFLETTDKKPSEVSARTFRTRFFNSKGRNENLYCLYAFAGRVGRGPTTTTHNPRREAATALPVSHANIAHVRNHE